MKQWWLKWTLGGSVRGMLTPSDYICREEDSPSISPHNENLPEHLGGGAWWGFNWITDFYRNIYQNKYNLLKSMQRNCAGLISGGFDTLWIISQNKRLSWGNIEYQSSFYFLKGGWLWNLTGLISPQKISLRNNAIMQDKIVMEGN